MTVYGGMALEQVIDQYNPRAAVPAYEEWLARWANESESARRELVGGRYDVRYGEGPAQCVDVFPGARPGSPISVFIHGGFWRFLDKSDHTLVSKPVVEAGHASVQVNYDLCPSVDLATVVHQVRQAIAWVYAHAGSFNGDRDRIYLAGHSAGAHLCAMTAMEGWTSAYGLPEDVIKGATIVSALFDLEPMLHIPGGEDLGLTEATFRDLSPLYSTPRIDLDYVVAVGADETAEWCRQTREMCARLRASGASIEALEIAGEHHYSILPAMADPRSPIGSAWLAQLARD